MGGKTWQAEEEHFFWRVLVPQSPEGVNPSERKYSWKECAELMQRELGHRQFRAYNKQLLYEHFYQNCKSERPSPRAKQFVREYLTARGPVPIERTRFTSRRRQPAESHSSVAPTTTQGVAEEEQALPVGTDQVPTHDMLSSYGLAAQDSSRISAVSAPAVYEHSMSEGFARSPVDYYMPPPGRAPLPLGLLPKPSFARPATQASGSVCLPPLASIPFDLGHQLTNGRPVTGGSYVGYENDYPNKQYQTYRIPDGRSGLEAQQTPGGSSDFRLTQDPVCHPSAETSQGASNPPAARNHGALFEALLQVTGASSIETSPESSSSERSRSISSSSTVSYTDEKGTKADAGDQQRQV